MNTKECVKRLQEIDQEIESTWEKGQVNFDNDGNVAKQHIKEYLFFLEKNDQFGMAKYLKNQPEEMHSTTCQWLKETRKLMIYWAGVHDDCLY